jgi:hypothetical protein
LLEKITMIGPGLSPFRPPSVRRRTSASPAGSLLSGESAGQ